MKKDYAKSKILAFILLFGILLFAAAAEASKDDTTVVVNSKEWRNVYLGSIYSGMIDADFTYFVNLKDAHLKTRTIGKTEHIIIIEPNSNAILKNYDSYLKVNGYKDYTTINFDDYSDLQETLWLSSDIRGKTKGYALLDPTFGVEAVASAPLLLERGYVPFFLTIKNRENILHIIDDGEIIIIGHFPIRTINHIDSLRRFTGYPDDNTDNITVYFNSIYPKDWGVVLASDKILPEVIAQTNPAFVYYGDIDRTVATIKKTNVTKFEAIGAEMVNLMSELKQKVGGDLKFIIRYGKTITNVEGMEGTILDLDTIYFDFPAAMVEIVKVEYYPEHNLTAVTFKVTGNIETIIFSNVEVAGTGFSDSNIHTLLPGAIYTLPFQGEQQIDLAEGASATLTTQYGFKMPLTKTLQSPTGSTFIKVPVSENPFKDTSKIEVVDYKFNDIDGSIIVIVKNPNKQAISLFGEYLVDSDTILDSRPIQLKAMQTQELVIPTPFHTWEQIRGNHTLNLYYGEKDTILKDTSQIQITKVIRENQGLASGVGLYVIIAVLAVIVLVVLFLIFRRRKRRHHHHHNF